MEWLSSYVDMQFVFLYSVVLFMFYSGLQGRTVSLIVIPCINIFEILKKCQKLAPFTKI